MRALSNLVSLMQGVVLRSFGLGWSLSYGEVPKSDLPCTIPSGLYNIHHLGAGFDTLTLSVTGYGDVHGSYRIQAESQDSRYPPLYEVWFDHRTARITCHGDTVDISTYLDVPTIKVAIAWNRELSRLDAVGAFYDTVHWQRFAIHMAQLLVIPAACVTMAAFMENHKRVLNALSGEQRFSYFLNQGFWGFTVPAIGALLSGASVPFMRFRTKYPLTASGAKVIGAQKNTTCDPIWFLSWRYQDS